MFNQGNIKEIFYISFGLIYINNNNSDCQKHKTKKKRKKTKQKRQTWTTYKMLNNFYLLSHYKNLF